MERNDLLTLMKTVAHAKRDASVAFNFKGENFSYEQLDSTLRDELRAYAGNYRQFEQNKDLIFGLMEETITEVLPKKVMDQWATFAEFKTVPQGQKAIFKTRITEASRRRAKNFIGKVGMAGRYEVFKLEGASYEVNATAIGGAAQISIEEYLDGRIDFADILDFVLEGMTEAIFYEIQKQMKAVAATTLAAKYPHNVDTVAGFTASKFDALIGIARSYGNATIYCTYEFAAAMVPDNNWISEQMKNERWGKGYLANYKGCNVIILPQSYTDETNSTKAIDPQVCYIIGGDTKPVKIVFEGGAVMKDFDNRDFSMEVQVYQKVGISVVLTPNLCVYKNTAIS